MMNSEYSVPYLSEYKYCYVHIQIFDRNLHSEVSYLRNSQSRLRTNNRTQIKKLLFIYSFRRFSRKIN